MQPAYGHFHYYINLVARAGLWFDGSMTGEQTGSQIVDIPVSPELIKVPYRVGVIDCGGQYVDLVVKAAERLGYYVDLLPIDTPIEELQYKYGALILSGSPANAQDVDAPMPDAQLWESGIPILGICYGMHAMAAANGGRVERGSIRQDGRIKTKVENKHPLFHHTKSEHTALFTHGNFVTELPEGFTAIGQHNITLLGKDGNEYQDTTYSAIARGNIVGVQFHPEVFDDSPEGYQIFQNFLGGIARLEPDPNLVNQRSEHLTDQLRQKIKEQAGDDHVIAFISGGVDSAVAMKLAMTEISPDKLHAFYIDNGYMREADDSVVEMLAASGIHVQKVDAIDYFIKATMEIDGQKIGPLDSITDPQLKRQLIGKAFIDIKNQLIKSLDITKALLLQGTNAADRIESGQSLGGTETELIKWHHNQVPEVQELEKLGLLIESLKGLFKNEIRILGQHLGLPDEIVWRPPFPGPGGAIRILCAEGHEYQDQTPEIQNNIQSFLDYQIDLNGIPCYAKLLPVRNVGVGGDERSHLAAVALESNANWEMLEKISEKILERFGRHVNRVIVPIGPESLQDLSVTPTKLTEQPRAQWRHAEQVVHRELVRFNLTRAMGQCPVVLLPLSFGIENKRSIVLRPVATTAFMTAQAMLPERDLPVGFIEWVAEQILSEVPDITQVFLDLTGKPPGTIEWE